MPDDFDIVDYAFLNPDLDGEFTEAVEYINHYLAFGLAERRRYDSGVLDRDFIGKIYGKDVAAKLTRTEMKRAHHSSEQPRLGWFYSSRRHLLASHGIRNAGFLDLFDYEYYYYANHLGEGASYHRTAEVECLRHFCEIGLSRLRPIADRLAFDPIFYQKTYGQDRASERNGSSPDDVVLYLDWLNSKPEQARAPNGRVWLSSRTGVDLPRPEILEVDVYRNANHDLAELQEDFAVAAHMLEFGLFEGRIAIPSTTASASVFTALADALAAAPGTESAARAKIVYDRVLRFTPDYAPAATHAAGHQKRQGGYREALDLLGRVVALRRDNPVTYFEMSLCAAGLKDAQGRLDALTAGISRFPGDFGLREMRRSSAEEFFSEEWQVAEAAAMAGRFGAAQSRVTAASRVALLPATDRAETQLIRSIALVANLDLQQCRFYRVEQKIEQLRLAGFSVSLFDVARDIPAFLSRLSGFQAAIFYRAGAFPSVSQAILAARAFGLHTFYEIDDLLFDPTLYPDSFDDYAGGVTLQEYAGLTLGVPLFAAAMALCDYGIASTPSLAEHMKPIVRTGQVFLHRNGFGSKHESWARRKPRCRNGPVRIFYGSGTKAHKKDFQDLLEPALERICEVHGDKVEIVLAGYNALSGRRPRLEERVTMFEPTWDIDEYWSLLGDVDVNLSVLKPSPLTAAKSEIKWLEAAMLGIPSVVSDVATLAGVIEEGVDGFLCRSADEFFVTIDRLVREPKLRTTVGEAARRKACSAYGLPQMADNLGAIMRSVSPDRPNKPKILFVNVFYPPQGIGGATRVLHDNLRDMIELAGEDFEFEVFTSIEGSHRGYETVCYAQDGVRVIGVTTPVEADHDRMATDPRMGSIFERHLAETKPTMIHFHCIQRLTVSLIEAAQRQAIPYIITVHDGWWISEHQFLLDERGETSLYDYGDPLAVQLKQGSAAFERMEALRPALEGAQAILAVSDRFAELYRGCGIARVQAVPNGVSEGLRSVVRRRSEPRVVLAHVGGLALHKGFPFFKYALSSELFENLSALVVDHSKPPGYSHIDVWGSTPVQIVGKFPQEEIIDLYGEIDVLVAPSLWDESFGLVTREALTTGCWVVASNRGSIGEPVVEGVNGYVVEPSVEGLADAFRRINEDPDRYKTRVPPPGLRTSRDQARDLLALYTRLLQAQSALDGSRESAIAHGRETSRGGSGPSEL